MPAISTVGGVTYFGTRGRQVRVHGDLKMQLNNFQWESVAGQDGHGSKRVPVTPWWKPTFPMTARCRYSGSLRWLMRPLPSSWIMAKPTFSGGVVFRPGPARHRRGAEQIGALVRGANRGLGTGAMSGAQMFAAEQPVPVPLSHPISAHGRRLPNWRFAR
jgi:hypothetical protein